MEELARRFCREAGMRIDRKRVVAKRAALASVDNVKLVEVKGGLTRASCLAQSRVAANLRQPRDHPPSARGARPPGAAPAKLLPHPPTSPRVASCLRGARPCHALSPCAARPRHPPLVAESGPPPAPAPPLPPPSCPRRAAGDPPSWRQSQGRPPESFPDLSAQLLRPLEVQMGHNHPVREAVAHCPCGARRWRPAAIAWPGAPVLQPRQHRSFATAALLRSEPSLSDGPTRHIRPRVPDREKDVRIS
jgi:hypothetical protein